jgi:hypothetical protein
VFTQLYQNLTNLNNLEKLGASTPANAKFQAIAKILKAYDWQQLVDVYNNVPYSQSFQDGVLFPKYDKGQDIYNDLVKQLDAAIDIINKNAGATDPGASDIVFGGDMTKWAKFANTIKLRLAIRQSNLGTNAAQADLAATAGIGYMDGTFQAAANPGFANSDSNNGQQSSFWRAYGFDQNGNPVGNNQYYRAGAYAVGLLTNFSDPRVSKYYDPTPAGPVKGNIFGDPNAIANADISAIGAGLLKDASQDAILMSSAEALFLQAEAVVRGWIPGNAQALYEAGITAAFKAVGLADTDATTYYTTGGQNVNWAASSGSTANQIEAIVTQKYLSLNGYNNFEGWSEFKRTGYPVGVPRSVDPKAIGTGIPNRIYYPTSEYQQNAASVGAEGTIDPFSSKIFWMP